MKIFDLSKIDRNFAFYILHFAFFQRTMLTKNFTRSKVFWCYLFFKIGNEKSKKSTKSSRTTVERTMYAKTLPSGKFFAELFFKKAT